MFQLKILIVIWPEIDVLNLCAAVFGQRSHVPVLIDFGVLRVELVFAEVVDDARANGVAKNVDGSPIKIITLNFKCHISKVPSPIWRECD